MYKCIIQSNERDKRFIYTNRKKTLLILRTVVQQNRTLHYITGGGARGPFFTSCRVYIIILQYIIVKLYTSDVQIKTLHEFFPASASVHHRAQAYLHQGHKK